MDTVAQYIGYGLMGIMAFAITLVILRKIIDFSYAYDLHLRLTVFNIGFIKMHRGNIMVPQVKELRKDEDAGFVLGRSIYFLVMPRWFNKYVANIGGVREEKK